MNIGATPLKGNQLVEQQLEGRMSLVKLEDTTANPAPLGLMGFGMTTVLLNLHNAGLFDLGSMILAMGIFYGGCAQIIAGLMEWKKIILLLVRLSLLMAFSG